MSHVQSTGSQDGRLRAASVRCPLPEQTVRRTIRTEAVLKICACGCAITGADGLQSMAMLGVDTALLHYPAITHNSGLSSGLPYVQPTQHNPTRSNPSPLRIARVDQSRWADRRKKQNKTKTNHTACLCSIPFHETIQSKDRKNRRKTIRTKKKETPHLLYPHLL